MCGIVAIFAYRAAAPGVSESELLTLRDAMRPRGPDGEGLWLSADGRVGLAHRRLAILDLSDAGAQPMPLDDDPLSLIITFNGEIYNYRELRAELEAQGSRFRSTSDTEVRLHLYRRDGTAMVERLRGMYAFVMWDARQRRLFAARDPFGIKPLYYADDGQTIRLASQVKALLAGGQIDTTAEPAGHAGFFLFGHVPEPFTLYKGIRTLPAGGVLTIGDGGQPSERQAIDIIDALVAAEADAGAASTDDAEIASALADSVRAHMVADVDVGAFLSAGKDSTTLVAPAARASSARLALTAWPGLGVAVRRAVWPLAKRFGNRKYASLIEYGGSHAQAYLLCRALYLPWELPAVLDAELARDGLERLAVFDCLRAVEGRLKSPRAKVSALEMSFYMRNQLLRDADWAGMAHSLEIRVPLVDTVLLKALAPRIVAPEPFSKDAMVEAVRAELPDALLNRAKSGFSVPVAAWMGGGTPGRFDHRAWARRVMDPTAGASLCTQ